MFIPRLYYPYALQKNELLTLDKTTSHYLINVLRLRNNDSVILFNGQGGEYSAQIKALNKCVQVNIIAFNPISRESPLHLHLGQALVRGDRMDWVIQKATELGVTCITPLLTKNCTIKLSEEREEKRLVHWQKIAISACEQCGRTQIPTIYPPLALVEWVKQSFAGASLLLDIGQSLKNIPRSSALRLAIGPESGWEQQETDFMKLQGFTVCSLGPRILRTETAGIVAISILQGLLGDINGELF